jgi:hypothetical protein
MKNSTEKRKDKITGSLSSFDRVLFSSYLPRRNGKGIENSMVRLSGSNQ